MSSSHHIALRASDRESRRAAPPKLDLHAAPQRVVGLVSALQPALVPGAKQVPSGTWWSWSRSSKLEPTWDVLEAVWRGPWVPPRDIPPALRRSWRKLNPPALALLRTAYAAAREQALTPRECLLLMALLVQPVRAASAPALPQDPKRKTKTNARTLPVIWAGHHIGPAYAAKSENQDATCIIRSSERHIFALADGVSTSMGAQYAAAIAVREFCVTLDELCRSQHDPSEALKRAVRSTQEQLESKLVRLLEDATHPEWNDLRASSKLPQDSALHLLRNTLSRSNLRWAPQMATTLIGGMLCRSGQGALRLHLIRIGDGVVELTRGRGGVNTILTMDTEAAYLDAYLCPGPNGKAAVEEADTRSLDLPADTASILVSSDGLARGHAHPVAYALDAACPKQLRALDHKDDSAAQGLLEQAARFADQRFAQARDEYFADNLSLIVIHCTPDRSPR